MIKYKVVKCNIIPGYLQPNGIEIENYAIFKKNHWWSKWKPYEPIDGIPPFKLRTKKDAERIAFTRNYCGI